MLGVGVGVDVVPTLGVMLGVGVGVDVVPILGVILGVGVGVGVVPIVGVGVGVGVTQADGLSPTKVIATPLIICVLVCPEATAVVPVVEPVYMSKGPTALFSCCNLTMIV